MSWTTCERVIYVQFKFEYPFPLDTDVNWTCVRRSEDVLHIIYVLCLGPCFSCFEQVFVQWRKGLYEVKKGSNAVT